MEGAVTRVIGGVSWDARHVALMIGALRAPLRWSVRHQWECESGPRTVSGLGDSGRPLTVPSNRGSVGRAGVLSEKGRSMKLAEAARDQCRGRNRGRPRRWFAAFLVAIAVALPASLSPVHAAPLDESDESTSLPGVYLGNESGTVRVPLDSPEAQLILDAIEDPDAVSPMWTVGAGWYLYLSLNHQDIAYLQTLAWGAFAGAVCFMLASTGPGAIACSVVAAAMWPVIQNLFGPHPPGHCFELRFTWGGFMLAGAKWVRRTC